MTKKPSPAERTTGSKMKGTGFFNIVKSSLAAAFGIQSQANRERDFKHGKPVHFIIAGIVTTVVFLALVGLFVKVMIATNT